MAASAPSVVTGVVIPRYSISRDWRCQVARLVSQARRYKKKGYAARIDDVGAVHHLGVYRGLS